MINKISKIGNEKNNIILSIDEIYEVEIFGEEKKQFQILYDLLKKIKQFVPRVEIVGGASRDLLLRKTNKHHKIINDIDMNIPTKKDLEKIIEYFKNDEEYDIDPSGLKFFHIKVIHKKTGFEYEFGSQRKEAYTDKNRKPLVGEGTLIEEIERRDFGINAVMLDLINVNDNKLQVKINPLSKIGIQHINNEILDTLQDPIKVFKDDPLRILRLLRFQSQFNFKTSRRIKEVLKKITYDDFNKISGERIQDELLKTLKHCDDIFIDQIILVIFPELKELYNYPNTLKHINKSIKTARKFNDDRLLWIALFHDIGKGQTAIQKENGSLIYPKHAEKSHELLHKFIDRLRFTKKDKNIILDVVKKHSRYKEIIHMSLSKVIDFVLENRNILNILSQFQEIDYMSHIESDFYTKYPIIENIQIEKRLKDIVNLINNIDPKIKKTFTKDYKSQLINYIINTLKYQEDFTNVTMPRNRYQTN